MESPIRFRIGRLVFSLSGLNTKSITTNIYSGYKDDSSPMKKELSLDLEHDDVIRAILRCFEYAKTHGETSPVEVLRESR